MRWPATIESRTEEQERAGRKDYAEEPEASTSGATLPPPGREVYCPSDPLHLGDRRSDDEHVQAGTPSKSSPMSKPSPISSPSTSALPSLGTTTTQRIWLQRASFLLPALWFALVAWQIVSVPAPSPMTTQKNLRFGLPESERQALFFQMVDQSAGWRKKAKGRFRGDAWSQQDDFFAHAHLYIDSLAKRRHLHTSQLYMIWDEGIHAHWAKHGARPLPAAPLPLKPRTR